MLSQCIGIHQTTKIINACVFNYSVHSFFFSSRILENHLDLYQYKTVCLHNNFITLPCQMYSNALFWVNKKKKMGKNEYSFINFIIFIVRRHLVPSLLSFITRHL